MAFLKQQLLEQREKQRKHDEQQLHEVFDELILTEATYLSDLRYRRTGVNLS